MDTDMWDMPTRGHPLLPNPFDNMTQLSLNNAYTSCLAMERRHLDDIFITHARYLGYLMKELPEEGAHVIAEEINLCENDDEMLTELSEYNMYRLIGLLTLNKTRTPNLSTPEYNQPVLSDVADPAPRDHQSAKHSVLVRDGFQCVITGDADSRSCSKMTVKQAQKYNLSRQHTCLSPTNLCHIISPSVNWNVEINNPDRQKERWSSSLLDIVKIFGILDLEELNGPKAYSLTNGLTMRVDIRHKFDRLGLWFERIPDAPQPNTYNARHISLMIDYHRLPPTKPITFTSSDPSLPLPDPKYLHLHATICRVAYFSGAHQYLMDLEEDNEGTLAPDGSSASALASRLEYLGMTA